MAQLVIDEPLASRIREVAKKDNLKPEELLTALVERVERQSASHTVIPDYPPRPASSLTDDDIEVTDDIADKESYRAAARAFAPKLYEKAREYWRKSGDTERLKLTEEQLDKQFWLIDHDGIPRLKSEKGTITLPHDPLEDLIGAIDTDQIDLSSTQIRS